jgi:hypothetical protein
MTTVHIGCGAGFAGDRADGGVAVAESLSGRTGPRYLVYETLAERTLALAQLARRADGRRGHTERLAEFLRPVLRRCVESGIRIVGNFGAANPPAAGRLVAELARDLGLPALRVAVVEGDDLLGYLPESEVRSWPVVEGLSLGAGPLIAANVYLGAGRIRAALDLGADVVVTGRIVDSALALGPLIHEFGWAADDWDRLAAGTLAGHLIECGPQVTGGYYADPGFKDVPGLAAVGFPIAEVTRDGTIVVTKPDGTGGRVDAATVTEQLLYEIHDPASYLGPDVTLDITGVTVAAAGPDRVVVRGARGRPPPATLKATVSGHGDWLAEAEISYAGPGARRRVELAAAVLRERLAGRPEPVRLDVIGVHSVLDSDAGVLRAAATDGPDGDFRLRLAASAADPDAARDLVAEVTALYTAGPAGGGGVRHAVTHRVRTSSVLVDRAVVRERVQLVGSGP